MSVLTAECTRARSCFSGYLDGAITGRQMQGVASHLQHCSACAQEFESWRGMQVLLAQTGAAKAPADLGLQIRVAISHETTRRQGQRHALAARWNNLVRPMMLQAASGVLGTLLLVGGFATLIGVVAAPNAVLANDEPLGAVTKPHFLYAAIEQQPVVTPDDGTIVVEAQINAEGRVYNWKIVDGSPDDLTLDQLRNQLMLQVYEPARIFGEPTKGKVLVTFSGVRVHG